VAQWFKLLDRAERFGEWHRKTNGTKEILGVKLMVFEDTSHTKNL
jgi:hypothetical protein